MIEFFSFFFNPYYSDTVAKYIHNGVGHTGIENDLYYGGGPAKIKHHGVGYTGIE